MEVILASQSPRRKELMGLFPEELRAWMAEKGEKAFRADQLFAWLHKGARFDEMSNLSIGRTAVCIRQNTSHQKSVFIR